MKQSRKNLDLSMGFRSIVCRVLITLPVFFSGRVFAQGVGDVFAGAAAIISATSPMVIEGIQSGANVEVAQIESETTHFTTTLQAQVAEKNMDVQRDIAFANIDALLRISQNNNQGMTERLGKELSELRAARESALESQREKMALEDKYNMMRIEIARQQADANYKLAEATLKSDLTARGLISGVAYTDSSRGLATGKLGAGGYVLPPRSDFGLGINRSEDAWTRPRTEAVSRLLSSVPQRFSSRVGTTMVSRAPSSRATPRIASTRTSSSALRGIAGIPHKSTSRASSYSQAITEPRHASR